jgi:hypothetical protein
LPVEKDIVLSLHVTEDETDTVATATLNLRGEHHETVGRARRNPSDPQRPIIGEELAIARALARLEEELMEAAQDKIDTFMAGG